MDDESYDCRYIRNVYLLKPLKDRALQELLKLNNPKQKLFFDTFSPVIDINDICNVLIHVVKINQLVLNVKIKIKIFVLMLNK